MDLVGTRLRCVHSTDLLYQGWPVSQMPGQVPGWPREGLQDGAGASVCTSRCSHFVLNKKHGQRGVSQR